MSYDISLKDPVDGAELHTDTAHALTGGTYAMHGTTRCWLNVTYNYATIFYRVFGDKGIRTIYGISGADSIAVLQAAANQLGNDTDADYWKATEGNAKSAILKLVALAKLRPDGIWDGD